MNALATLVAGYGLFANSTAVVIGAMLIAMLLGPIMGLAMGLVDGDTQLLKRASIAETVGAIMVVMIAFIMGRMHFDLPITAEMMARVHPNLLDLMIALAGGAAGAYATVSPKVNAGIVGVAIATALVPPLTTCGICLSRGLYDLAGGAFLLFATNLVAIQAAASLVLFLHGFHNITQKDGNDNGYVRRLVLDGVLLAGLAVFMFFQLAATVREQQYREAVKTTLRTSLKVLPGAYLVEVDHFTEGDVKTVVAVVRTPNSLTPKQTAGIQDALKESTGENLRLHVRSVLTKETTSDGYLHELDPARPAIEDRLSGLHSNGDLGETPSEIPLNSSPEDPAGIRPEELSEGQDLPK
jgi:uncharacterized hydrophobic protein (TIGR00271 family)